jgi:ribosomal protein L15
MLSLHSLEPSRSTKDAKRRGRGNASGRGTYSTRGIKGQRARSGGRGGLVLKGVRGYILRVPKSRGFKSLAPEMVAISLRQLDGAFQDGEVVTLKKIQQAGFTAKGAMTRIKIIGGGLLKKKLLELFVIAQNGMGKRTNVDEYKTQGRGGSGIKTMNVTDKTGEIVGGYVVNTSEERDLLVISKKGQVIRLPFGSIKSQGRATQGVRLMRFKEEGDTVASTTLV